MSQESTASMTPTRLMLVDDEAAILSGLRRLLRSSEYEIHTAGGGEEALKMLRQTPVDIIISDMRMPGMSGAEFLAQAAKEWPDTIRMVLTGYADLGDTIAAINSGHIYRYFSKPWDEDDLRLSVRRAVEQLRLKRENSRLQALTSRQNEELKSLNTGLEERVVARTAELKQTADMLDNAYGELKENYNHTVELLVHLTDLSGPSTKGHGRRVAELSKLMAQRMELDLHSIQNIRSAGLLHDIGKMVLPDELVNAPYSTLSREGQQQMEKHAKLGEAALMGLPPLKDAAGLIRSHHEQFDGNGYPDGLIGEAIPLGARIIGVAEAYDELCVGTMMGHAHTPTEAIEFISRGGGSRYDPAVVKVCVALQEELSKVHQQAEPSVLCISTRDLEAGMVLVSNLMSSDGMLLLTTGHKLTAPIIEKIKRIEQEDKTGYTLNVHLQ
jgi:response regulator RpfG family c-di-GMP phosphodiesterase